MPVDAARPSAADGVEPIARWWSVHSLASSIVDRLIAYDVDDATADRMVDTYAAVQWSIRHSHAIAVAVAASSHVRSVAVLVDDSAKTVSVKIDEAARKDMQLEGDDTMCYCHSNIHLQLRILISPSDTPTSLLVLHVVVFLLHSPSSPSWCGGCCCC